LNWIKSFEIENWIKWAENLEFLKDLNQLQLGSIIEEDQIEWKRLKIREE